MALSHGRSGQRFSTNIWPGYVDALSTLILVLTFVVTIFMVVQFVLSEQITTQGSELEALGEQVAGLADALGLERGRTAALGADLADAQAKADRQAALIANLTASLDTRTAELGDARARITSFEAQVASLLTERDRARGEAEALGAERDRLASAEEALNLAVATARSEIDRQAEEARLAAARREALEALIADMRGRDATQDAALTEAEGARLAEAAAAAALRDKLEGAEDELTAMTLALEAQRRRAEETLTLLAAAEAARKDLDTRLAAAILAETATKDQLAAATAAAEAARTATDADRKAVEDQLAAALAAKLAAAEQSKSALDEAERQRALLATANDRLAEETAASAAAARKVTLLNEQVAALRGQLGSLQELLDASAAKDADAKVQIEALGTQLNSALARVAAEEKRRAALEEAERLRLEAEAKALKEETKELSRYRSEFFGKLSQVLAGREGVRVVGDRFVFSSEVLFEPGSATLSAEGKSQIAGVVRTLQEVAAAIPPEIDWIIRVDGHTDDTPLSGKGSFRDNWELSQARALSVVRYMQDDLGFPPNRLAAAGFGEYQPVAQGDSPEVRALNRRIEMKLTDR